MPVKPGTHLDPEATKVKVLDAAAELFYQRGVHAVGVNDVAARAGASKLSIYRYFHSKEGLVAAMLSRRSDRIHDWLNEQIDHVAPGRERVLTLFDRLGAWFVENEFRGCAVVNTVIDTRGTDAVIRPTAQEHLARYRGLLATELTTAAYAEPEALARRLLLLIEGATVVTAIDGTPEAGTDARRAAEALLDTAPRSWPKG